jgi:hypothetical protein
LDNAGTARGNILFSIGEILKKILRKKWEKENNKKLSWFLT